MFYIFVRLNKVDERPEFHIVPTSYVANKVKKGHQSWLDTPGRGGRKRKNTDMRKFGQVPILYPPKFKTQ